MYPVRYRTDTDSVPPAFGRDWEWSMTRFLVHKHWFDYFLVRDPKAPHAYFSDDRKIQFVAQSQDFWLFARQR
jgi:hypothetical protein